MVLADLPTDYTLVICTAISAVPATLAAWAGLSSRRQLRTPSGDPIGHVVERAHETAVANNLLLSVKNGPTKHADSDSIKQATEAGPSIPDTGVDHAG